jgi:SAM-dependent methyltransferase
MPRQRWNHNLHHYGLLLDAVPSGCRRALDVGCGEGTLARLLRARIAEVCAIDVLRVRAFAAICCGGTRWSGRNRGRSLHDVFDHIAALVGEAHPHRMARCGSALQPFFQLREVGSRPIQAEDASGWEAEHL